MFDPLKRLMTKLMELHYNRAKGFEIERLIFIGDYIDYGPSSREVIDLLVDLPFGKVLCSPQSFQLRGHPITIGVRVEDLAASVRPGDANGTQFLESAYHFAAGWPSSPTDADPH